MNEEEKAMAAYAEAGVDLPELKEEPNKEEPPQEEPKAAETPKPEEPKEPLQEEPKQERKRSIYDDLKQKKQDVREERERREQAERERDEFRTKYEALANAGTQEQRETAAADIESFATKIGADPEALREMQKLFLKDVKPQTDEDIAKGIQEFRAWKQQNEQMLESQLFESEFQSAIPTLKQLLPNASDDEMNAVKVKLDELSHTKENHDKELGYIAWKHKDELSALVSPKKRGLESKTKIDVAEEDSSFDPQADLSKMTPKQRDEWENEYRKLTSSKELTTDTDGRMLML